MRKREPLDFALTLGAIVLMWLLFFVFIGFAARAAKELFCLGYGC